MGGEVRALAALVVLALPAQAAAQGGPCLPRAEAIDKLERHYQEQQVGVGVVAGGRSLVELYVSETGSWTIIITHANGLSCVTASGDGWVTVRADGEKGT